MERKVGEWEKRVQRLEESRKRGQKRVKDSKQTELKNFQGRRGRVEVEKVENDKEQRGGRRERKRSNRGG